MGRLHYGAWKNAALAECQHAVKSYEIIWSKSTWQSSPHQQGLDTGGLGNARDLTPPAAWWLPCARWAIVPEPGREIEVDVADDEGIVVEY